MREADALNQDFGGIVVAEGVEGVADIVAGAGDGHTGVEQVVDQRESAPERRARKGGAGGAAVLEVDVAERKGNDADAGGLHDVDGRAGTVAGLHGQTAAVAADDRKREAVAEHALGHVPEALGGGIVVFVDV